MEIDEYLFFRRIHSEQPFRVNKGIVELAAWFDPKYRLRRIFPETQLLLEYNRAINYASIKQIEKIKCYWLFFRYWFPPNWKTIAREIRRLGYGEKK